MNNMQLRHSTVTVDLDAIRSNYRYLQQTAANCKCVAVIKADAYGHGAVQVAKALSTEPVKADAFAVATVPEAVQLRQAGIQQKIIILGGYINQQELDLAIKHQLDCVIHSSYQIDLLKNSENKTLNLWIKVNSGMGRLGFGLEEMEGVVQTLKEYKIVCLMSHFASADDLNNEKTKQQIENIKALGLDRFDWSIANSAGTLGWLKSHQQWVRFGIALYGINPFDGQNQSTEALKPVMRFESEVVAIYQRKQREGIGYSSTYICEQETRVGVIGVGYADGYPRHIDENAYVSINGKAVKIIGRVSMDMITVDLTPNEEVDIGDRVIMWHQNPSAEEIAISSGTIAYELCCNAGAHAQVHYKETE